MSKLVIIRKSCAEAWKIDSLNSLTTTWQIMQLEWTGILAIETLSPSVKLLTTG